MLINKINLKLLIFIIYILIYFIRLLGIGDWGLGIGPNPQSPIPNPQSPIPIPMIKYIKIYIMNINNFKFILLINI